MAAITLNSFEEQLPGLLNRIVGIPGVRNPSIRCYKESPSTLFFRTNQTLKREYTVTYHISYNTPVVYFREYQPIEGGWKLVYSTIPQSSITEFQGQNWLFLHPCDSDMVIQDGSLESWASVYLARLLPLRVEHWFGD